MEALVFSHDVLEIIAWDEYGDGWEHKYDSSDSRGSTWRRASTYDTPRYEV